MAALSSLHGLHILHCFPSYQPSLPSPPLPPVLYPGEQSRTRLAAAFGVLTSLLDCYMARALLFSSALAFVSYCLSVYSRVCTANEPAIDIDTGFFLCAEMWGGVRGEHH